MSYLMSLHPISVRIHSSFSFNHKRNLFLAANNTAFIVQQMREMENLTMVNNTQCIRFRPKNVTDPFFITIFNGSGCYAPVSTKFVLISTFMNVIRWVLGELIMEFAVFHCSIVPMQLVWCQASFNMN